MSEGEVLVSGGEASESGREILESLPPWMPRDESTGNFKLLDVVGRGLDRLDDDIRDVDAANNIQTAESIEQLQALAQLVDVSPKSNESVEKYRRRIIGEFQNTTNEGDLPGIMGNVSVLLDVGLGDIEYSQGTENGSFILSLPSNAIGSAALTKDEFSDIIGGQVAAGFRLDVQSRGTFTYLTPSMYQNGDSDSSLGYDGLTSSGERKDNGGTYAGVLS